VGERLAELGGGGRGRVARQPLHRCRRRVVLRPAVRTDRALFERLAVFAGGWSAHAARHLRRCRRRSSRRPAGATRGQSWSSHARTAAGPLHDARADSGVRVGRLVESGNDDEVRAAHARYFVDLAEQADAECEPPTSRPGWPAGPGSEQLRVAHRRLVESGDADGDLRLVAALYWYGYAAGAAEVFGWAEEAARQFTNVTHRVCPPCAAWARSGPGGGAISSGPGPWPSRASSPPRATRAPVASPGRRWATSTASRATSPTACEHFLVARDLAHAVGDHLLEGMTTADAALVVAYSGDMQRACGVGPSR